MSWRVPVPVMNVLSLTPTLHPPTHHLIDPIVSGYQQLTSVFGAVQQLMHVNC